MPDSSHGAASTWSAVSHAFATFTSDTRLYDIDTPLGRDVLLVESWVGKETLSSLYEWQITCLSTGVDIELKRLLGQQVVLRTRLADGTQGRRSGYVSAVAQLGSDGGLARYRLTVVPWLWLATQRRTSRVFQDKSVLDIVAEVLAADTPRARWRVAPEVQRFLAGVPPRSYCCQYRESDYAFISRLLAEEGIGFCFEEVDADQQTGGPSHQCLVLFCDSTVFPDDRSAASVHGGPGIRFHRNASVEPQDAIHAFGAERTLQAATTTLGSWDYKTKRVVAASLPTSHQFGGEHAPHVESYDWAGAYAFANPGAAEHYARLLREAADARFKTWFGNGGVRTFRAGTAFDITGSPLDQLTRYGANAPQRRFALTGVLHAGVNNLPAALKKSADHWLGAPPGSAPSIACGPGHSQRSTAGSERNDAHVHLSADAWDRLLHEAQGTGYANRFTAIRSDIVWRPTLSDGTGALLNPKPTAWGSQTAIVVGPDGSTSAPGTVHTDHLGRVRIHFPWQTAETSTCWVRVAQMFAGPGYGAQFIPRIGQEVVVKFIENDIDRPLVTGVLYNGQGQDDQQNFSQAGDHAPAGQDNKVGSGAAPPWHGAAADHRHAGFLSGFKSVALGADGYTRHSNQLVFDDTTGRLRTKLASDTAATQLNLGHLIHQADNYRGGFRGTGWELRSDAHGAIRAGKGLLMTTYYGSTPDGQPEPAGENSPGIGLLKQAQGFAAAFNRAAAAHQTVQFILVKGHSHNGEQIQSRLDDALAPIAAMLKALSGLVDAHDGSIGSTGKKIPHMHAPLVVVTAQAGIGVTASDGLHVAAGEVAHFASGRDTHFAVGEALTVHSGQAIGLLAGAVGAGDDNAGIKLYAGQGDVELQAHSDEMTFAAKELIRLISANSHVDFAAAKSLTLCTEGGAGLTMEGGNITFACPGTISIQAASKSFTGPARMNYKLGQMPRGIFKLKKNYPISR